jgi:hypothetical protein
MTRRLESAPTRAAAKLAYAILVGRRRIPNERVLHPSRGGGCQCRKERLEPWRVGGIQEVLPFKAIIVSG